IHDGTESVANDFFDNNPQIIDWVIVELRTSTDAASKVSSRACFLKSDGSIVDLDGTSDVEFTNLDPNIDEYYVVVHHRNHLPVMSAAAVSIN
ncbi:MAG: hypothetical protein KDC52_13905, partial [Ignavibacteriae bacterium]|nr:hypothetical protein [Ignavibacteriota bacterium]